MLRKQPPRCPSPAATTLGNPGIIARDAGIIARDAGTVADMIAEHEPRLHALSASPQLARSGDTVRFVFRLRNHACSATAPAIVRFVIDPALEMLDPSERAIEAAPPGGLLTASVRARVPGGLDDRATLGAQAFVTFANAEWARASLATTESLATNLCSVTVRTNARLDGDASGTCIERVNAQRVRIRAWCVNDGDGPAKDVALTVRVPPSCASENGEEFAHAFASRLAPGERLDAEMLARIIAPALRLCAHDASVAHSGGPARTLTRALPLALEPELGAPNITVVPKSGHAAISIRVPNEGWVDANDVSVAIALPKALRVIPTTLAVDGITIPLRKPRPKERAIAAIERTDEGFGVVAARIPARSAVLIEFETLTPPDGTANAIVVRVDEHAVSTDVCAPALAEIRIRAVDPPRSIERGTHVALAIELINAGRIAQVLDVALEGGADGAVATHVALRPRELAVVTIELPSTAVEPVAGEPQVTVAIVARSGIIEVARTTFSYEVRNRSVSPAEAQPIALSMRDTGPQRLENAMRDGGRLQRLEVGASSDGPPPDVLSPESNLTATISSPARVRCGARLDIVTVLEAAAPVNELVFGSVTDESCLYVPGSTTVGGRAIAEPSDGQSAIDALSLGAIERQTRVRIAWAVVPTTMPENGQLTVAASGVADGIAYAAEPSHVIVEDRAPFAAWSPDRSYFVDASPADDTAVASGTSAGSFVVDVASRNASIGGQPNDSIPLHADSRETKPHQFEASDTGSLGTGSLDSESFDAGTLVPTPIAETDRNEDAAGTATRVARPAVLHFSDEWRAELQRLVCRTEDDGLLGHVFALRALFPDQIDCADPVPQLALRNARAALRDVLDRLFVKVRIPGFPVAADDVEDPRLRDAMRALFAACAIHGIALVEHDDAIATLENAPRGAPEVLRIFGALLLCAAATSSDVGQLTHRHLGAEASASSRTEEALTRYLRAFDAALGNFVGMPSGTFDDALTTGRYPALDTARAGLAAALGARRAGMVEW